MHKFH